MITINSSATYLLQTVFLLKDDPARSWLTDLDRIGVWDEVQPLYKQGWPIEFANRVLAFIVLSYSNESRWVELQRDRTENKEKIAKRLGLNLKDQVVRKIIRREEDAVQETVAWFFQFQQDWRWETIITCFEYHSTTMRWANSPTMNEVEEIYDNPEFGKKEGSDATIRKVTYIPEEKIASINLSKGKAIQEAINQRRKGEELLSEIKKEFMQLDAIADKEGIARPTDAANILSWENYVRDRNERNKLLGKK